MIVPNAKNGNCGFGKIFAFRIPPSSLRESDVGSPFKILSILRQSLRQPTYIHDRKATRVPVLT